MDLGNPVETIVYYILIGGMTCLNHWDRFLMVSALVYMVTYGTKPMVNHDIRLLIVIIHQTIILYGLSALKEYWGYVKVNERLWLLGETLRWSHISMDWVIVDGS